MVEKDFWVSWTLAVLFQHAEFRGQLVFKGGTSLSKVFGVIERFSEDIDLSVGPEFLGISEKLVEKADTRKKADGWMKEMEAACSKRVRERFLPELERIARESLGKRDGGGDWMKFEVDGTAGSPLVLFHYPTSEPTGFDYLSRFVKMEFGSLTDQKPVATHDILPWLAEAFPKQLNDFKCNLVALELEWTFWEKATILHAEYHRERTTPFRDRLSRHYSDTAALALHPVAKTALAQNDLRQQVVNWKNQFFASTRARYDLAKPGTFRLGPPEFRMAELQKDYKAMKDMFLVTPPSFENVIKTVADLELRINSSPA